MHINTRVHKYPYPHYRQTRASCIIYCTCTNLLTAQTGMFPTCLQTHTHTQRTHTLPNLSIKSHVCMCLYLKVSVEFISGLIKLWRAVSVGRLQTEYAVNRLLIEREREIRGAEERIHEERYGREEEGGDERGIAMSAESHFTSESDQTRGDAPLRHTCGSRLTL